MNLYPDLLFENELQLRSTPVELHQANDDDDLLGRSCDRRPGTCRNLSNEAQNSAVYIHLKGTANVYEFELFGTL